MLLEIDVYMLFCISFITEWPQFTDHIVAHTFNAFSFYVHVSCSSGQQVSVETETSIQMTWSETVLYAVFLTFWIV